jgi:hypothetical protein
MKRCFVLLEGIDRGLACQGESECAKAREEIGDAPRIPYALLD